MAAAGKQTLRFIFRLFSIFSNQMYCLGRKKSGDLSRKHSAGSSKSGVVSPPQDDTSESDSFHQRPHTGARSGLARHAASAPSSAKSRSSESSGYISRSADSRGRVVRVCCVLSYNVLFPQLINSERMQDQVPRAPRQEHPTHCAVSHTQTLHLPLRPNNQQTEAAQV